MRTIFLILVFIVLLPARVTAKSYSVGKHTLDIPTPNGYSIAPKKLVINHDKGRAAAGSSGRRRFVMFVRDGSLDPTGVQGDTFSVSLTDYSDYDVSFDDFNEFKSNIREYFKSGYGINAKHEFTEDGLYWITSGMTVKMPIPQSQGKIVQIYTLMGMFLVRGHIYIYVSQTFDATSDIKTKVKKSAKNWLQEITGEIHCVQNKKTPKSADKLYSKTKRRSSGFSDLLQVGEISSSRKQLLDDSVFDMLKKEKTLKVRTLGKEKADGIDVQISYPSSMTCNDGNQPHIVYNIKKFFPDEKISLGFNLGVWPYPSDLLDTIRTLDPQDAKTDEFVEFIRDVFCNKGQLIGCGITKLFNQSVIWYTTALTCERLGHSFSIISRQFIIPSTSSHCIVCDVSAISIGDQFPVEDFAQFLPLGIRFVNSLTFMDKCQLKNFESTKAEMTGTGWFVTPEHIVTCWHIVQGYSDFRFRTNKSEEGKLILVGKDEFSDLAVLRVVDNSIQCENPLPIASNKINVADKVFTVGYPLPKYMGRAAKYTEGVVSSLSGMGDDESFLQISTPVQQGNSGGALMNESCEVVGVVQSKLEPTGNAREAIDTAQNVNYATKACLIRRLLKRSRIDIPKKTKSSTKSKYDRVCEATVFIYSK